METFLRKKDPKDLKQALILSAFLDSYRETQKNNKFCAICLKFYNEAKMGGLSGKALHGALHMPTEAILNHIAEADISLEDAGKFLVTISLLRDGFTLSEEDITEKICVAMLQHEFLLEAANKSL